MKPGAKAGQTLDGRFELIDELARGGMSTVWKARDLRGGGEPVVVKVPLPIFSSGVGVWSMFQQEEAIGRQLDHPFILKFLPLPEDRRRSYVVTEYVSGKTLAQRLDEQRPLPEAEALSLASQICAALDHLHDRGFVHYDLKPANVMLCPDGSIRVIDFGLAHAVESARFTLSGAPPAIGSSNYIAPEQIKRKRGRPSADVYAVGATLYELLTGLPPFPDDDPFVVASARTLGDPPAPRAVNPRISPQAEDIVLRALRRDPAERYASAAAMKAALDDPQNVLVSGLCDQLRPVTPAKRFWRLLRHAALVGVLPVATQIALFFLIWHHLTHKR
jgi:serine/threonine-protein kinase